MRLAELREQFPRPGRLEWIGLRTKTRQPLAVVEQAEAKGDKGLTGDRAGQRPGSKRQVTLLQAEHLPVIAALSGVSTVTPEMLRRNLIVAGINLLALRDQRFYIGDVLLEATGLCHPCARMEQVLGEGGYNAMRGYGGLTACVISGGIFQIGDGVRHQPL